MVTRSPVRTAVDVIKALTELLAPPHLPDLARLTQDPGVRARDAEAAAWLDVHFDRMEHAAPWLVRVAGTVLDYCLTGTSPRGFMQRGTFGVECTRTVTVAYAFSGGLDARLEQLSEVLTEAGWKEPFRAGGLYLAGREPPVKGEWRTDAAPGPPGRVATAWDQDDAPAAPPGIRCVIQVAWTVPGRSSEPVAALLSVGEEPERVTNSYRPVEVRRAEPADVVMAALSQQPHVAAIRVILSYYDFPRRVPAGRCWADSGRG